LQLPPAQSLRSARTSPPPLPGADAQHVPPRLLARAWAPSAQRLRSAATPTLAGSWP